MKGGAAAALAVFVVFAGAAPGKGDELSRKLLPCLACHGAGGQSQTALVPSLGAQQSGYTITQLFLFREGMRTAAPMNAMSKGLGDDDLRAFAAAFARLPAPRPPSGPADAARLDRARQLAAQNHCNVCHRPDYSGQQSVPRLADQREDYLLKSLRDYKSGARRGYEPTMAEALQPVDDAQLADLAYYLARFQH
jgi:cytochrome c553